MTRKERIVLEHDINTEDWKCAVSFIAEKDSNSTFFIDTFTKAASNGRRLDIKCLDRSEVDNLLHEFKDNHLESRYKYLLNYQTLFTSANGVLEHGETLPTAMLAEIIKTIIKYIKHEHIKMKEEMKRRSEINPVEIMKKRPMKPVIKGQSPSSGGRTRSKSPSSKRGKSRDSERKSPPSTKTEKSKKKAKTKKSDVRNKPASVVKPDTLLLKRGEPVKESNLIIDDNPVDGFQLYLALTGFHEPDLIIELMKIDVPLCHILCVDLSRVQVGQHFSRENIANLETLSHKSKIDRFWFDFLKILWDKSLVSYFKDIVFEVFRPVYIPVKNIDNFIYNQFSFLLYELADVTRRHTNYLQHLSITDVADQEKFPLDFRYIDELDFSKCECITVPIMVQYLLDQLCGEDAIDDVSELGEGEDGLYSLMLIKRKSQTMTPDCIPTPSWGDMLSYIDDDIRGSIHRKMVELNKKYHINDDVCLTSLQGRVSDCCGVILNPHERIYARNTVAAVLYKQSGGFANELWYNYTDPDESSLKTGCDTSVETVKTPVVLDYCLFSLWMSKVPCFRFVYGTDYSGSETAEPETICSDTDFNLIEEMQHTVTSCSRRVLKPSIAKMHTTEKEFFQSSNLKVMPPEATKAFSDFEMNKKKYRNFDLNLLKHERICFSDFEVPHNFACKLVTDDHLYDNIRSFLGEQVFEIAGHFDMVEELDERKLYKHLEDAKKWYNCIDHMHSTLTDTILVKFHNIVDEDNLYRETFNVTLRTPVALRDFFDYVVDDEKIWLEEQEKIYLELLAELSLQIPPNPLYSPKPDFRDFIDSDFLLENSIKYKALYGEDKKKLKKKKSKGSVKSKTDQSKKKKKDTDGASTKTSKTGQTQLTSTNEGDTLTELPHEVSLEFTGYNIEPLCVQFSGFQTTYYGPHCKTTVALQERLYGTQDLGLHIQQNGHVLYVYSEVCPTPTLIQPFTFHIELNNNIIVAFSKTNFYKEPVMGYLKQAKSLEYDMSLSLPTGLTLKTMCSHDKRLYIKQCYLQNSPSSSEIKETSRCYLHNGALIKILENESVEVLNSNTTLCRTKLYDLHLTHEQNNEYGGEDSAWFYMLTNYNAITTTNQDVTVTHGMITDHSKLFTIKNTNRETNTEYHRRSDGTNYVFFADGMLCIEYKDGSKISSIGYEVEEIFDWGENMEELIDGDYVSVHIKFIFEHDDYATVIYESYTEEWSILLPSDAKINITRDGRYSLLLDKHSYVKINHSNIDMTYTNDRDNAYSNTRIDLSVFDEVGKENFYCKTQDSTGRSFIVKSNGNHFITHNSDLAPEESNLYSPESSRSFVTPTCKSPINEVINRGETLSNNARYFVIRRDRTGFELKHVSEGTRDIQHPDANTLVYSDVMWNKLRYYVLLKLAQANKEHCSWKVKRITPEAKFKPLLMDENMTRSTYGDPPSWMHPFPKKKRTINIDDVTVSARVLIETRDTHNYKIPSTGNFNFCTIGKQVKQNLTNMRLFEGCVKSVEYFKKVAANDKDILKELYSLSVRSKIEAVKNSNHFDNTKLEHYLKMSEYFVNLQNYHKYMLRHDMVPVYFAHPAGMSWLILSEIAEMAVTLSEEKEVPEPEDSYSGTEVEYNLDISDKSCSMLCKVSDASAMTSPTIGKARDEPEFQLSSRSRSIHSEPPIKYDLHLFSSVLYRDTDAYADHDPTFNYQQFGSGTCILNKNVETEFRRRSTCCKKNNDLDAMSLSDVFLLGYI